MRFRKKAEKGLFCEVDDSRHIVYDFRRRIKTLFEDYRSIGYKMPPDYDIETIKVKLDKNLEGLKYANAIDAGNEDCMVETILDYVRNGIPYLDNQALEHQDFLARYCARLRSDYMDIDEMLSLNC